MRASLLLCSLLLLACDDPKKAPPAPAPSASPAPSPSVVEAKKEEPKKEEPKKEDDLKVECILDPNAPGCKKGGGGGGGGGTTKPPVDSNLPEKLELGDIKAGTDGPKASAKSSCASKAKGGEKVQIKLSINGPAGTVSSASIIDAAGNDALANCVLAELKKATFKKTAKEAQGTQISVSF